MKHKLLILMLLASASSFVYAKEPNLQRAHGEIVLTNPAENRISIGGDSKAGSIRVQQFQINSRTRLLGFGQISELKIGQKSEVTYFQDQKGQFIATQVELIKAREDEIVEKEVKNKDSEDFHF